MKSENDNAVSPVIGVILLIAITVILAAVIAIFVYSNADRMIPAAEQCAHDAMEKMSRGGVGCRCTGGIYSPVAICDSYTRNITIKGKYIGMRPCGFASTCNHYVIAVNEDDFDRTTENFKVYSSLELGSTYTVREAYLYNDEFTIKEIIGFPSENVQGGT